MKKQMKISAIGDGTTTGAIHSLNSNLSFHFMIFPTSFNSYTTLYILADITDWFNRVNISTKIFCAGNIFYARAGYNYNNITEITISISYKRETYDTYRLYSSRTDFTPCILKYTKDDTVSYKLALKLNKTYQYGVYFNGFIAGINTIQAVPCPTSQDFPDGYELAFENGQPHKINDNSLTLGVGVSENAYYTYDQIKELEDRLTILENS